MNLVLSNVPVVNLRTKFEEYLRIFRSPDFKQTIFNCGMSSAHLPNLSWHGLPNDLLTLMLQRTVVGLECYVSSGAEYELSKRGCLTQDLERQIRNPFLLDRSGVVAFYEKLPQLVDVSLGLRAQSSKIFDDLASFYKSVRNPIFHGGLLAFSGDNYDRVASAFELFARVYDWINSWYTAPPEGWQHIGTPNNPARANACAQ